MAKSSHQRQQMTEDQLAKMMQMLAQAEELKCKCGSVLFTGANRVKKLSRIVTGEEQDTLIPVPVIMCAKCHEELLQEEAMPQNDGVIELDFRKK